MADLEKAPKPELGEAWAALSRNQKILFAVLIPVVMVGLLWGAMAMGGDGGGGSGSACDAYDDRIAEQITWLQMADDSLSFSDAHIQAEMIEGPPPSGC